MGNPSEFLLIHPKEVVPWSKGPKCCAILEVLVNHGVTTTRDKKPKRLSRAAVLGRT